MDGYASALRHFSPQEVCQLLQEQGVLYASEDFVASGKILHTALSMIISACEEEELLITRFLVLQAKCSKDTASKVVKWLITKLDNSNTFLVILIN